MKDRITKKEMNALNKIDAINVNKEACKILENPRQYFDLHLKKISNPVAIIFAHLSVIAVLRKMDTDEKICEITSDYFFDKYDITEWLAKLNDFYIYIIYVIDYVLENHDNVVLDSFNLGQIDKKILNKGMKAFVPVRKRLIEDKEALKICLEDLAKEAERAQDSEEGLDLGD